MTQTITLILVLILVVEKFSVKKIDLKTLWYYIRFWKPIRSWIWSKHPEIPDELYGRFRGKAIEKVLDTPEKIEVSQYSLPYYLLLKAWSPEDLSKKKEQDKLWDEIKKEEKNLKNQWRKKNAPLFYYLLLFKIIIQR